MRSFARNTLLALLSICVISAAARSQPLAPTHIAVGVHRVLPPTASSFVPVTLSASATDRERRGTYAGIGMLVGFVAGAVYGNAHTSHDASGLFIVMLYGCGGMILGAVSGVAIYEVVR